MSAWLGDNKEEISSLGKVQQQTYDEALKNFEKAVIGFGQIYESTGTPVLDITRIVLYLKTLRRK